jgi:hypothetical protein
MSPGGRSQRLIVVSHPPHQLLEDGRRSVAAGAHMHVTRPPEQSGNLVDDCAGIVPTVCVAHQPDTPPLLLNRAARFAHIDEAPDRVSEVGATRTRNDGLIPVDQTNRLVTDEDGVVRAQVAVTDDLLGARRHAAGGGVVEAADESGRAGQLGVGHAQLRGVGRGHVDLTLDKAQDLAAGLVHTEHPGRPGEPDHFQISQYRLDELRVSMRGRRTVSPTRTTPAVWRPPASRCSSITATYRAHLSSESFGQREANAPVRVAGQSTAA